MLLVTLVLLGLMLALSGWLTRSTSDEHREAAAWEEHTFQVLDIIAELRFGTISVLRGERGYLLTHDTTYLEPRQEGGETITRTLTSLADAVRDNPEQVARVENAAELIANYERIVDDMIALESSGRHDEALARVRSGEGRRSITLIFDELDRLEAAERELLAQRRRHTDAAADRADVVEYALSATGILLLALGALASFALRRSLTREAEARAELARIATTDELTGLANRRELFSSLDRMIAASRRSGRPLAIGILDIDRFKLVNDTHGHPAGDEVIRRVAQMALQLMREQDLVGRLGGEEFLIAFPDCDAQSALAACERLRAGVAALPILLPEGVGLKVTVSSGVAQLVDDDDRTRLIGRADEALYHAKKGGRDQVRLAA